MKLLVCGGGNGAHVLAGMASSNSDIDVKVLTLYGDEAQRWRQTMERNGGLTLNVHDAEGEVKHIKANPTISDHPSLAVGCDIIILCVPAFAHDQYLRELKDHVTPGCVLVGLPGQAGFEFAVKGHWGDLAGKCTVVNMETLPWACRIEKFGSSVDVLGTKDSLTGSFRQGDVKSKMDPTEMLQHVVGALPRIRLAGHILGVTLMALNGAAHPSIMYGEWRDWDGQPVLTPPLFYHGLSQFSADTMSEVSQEMVDTAAAIAKKYPQVDLANVCHLHPWLARTYPDQIADASSLRSCFRTNAPYANLVHPMNSTDDGKYVPNFQSRYLQEDIPFGLVVSKGIAELVGMATPNIDRVLTWSQDKLGHEYLVDGKLIGKDVKNSRCPQAYGLHKLEDII